MLALLKLIPFKDWCYGALIVALIAAFGAYTIHERHVQAAKDAAKDAALAQKQIAHNEKVETHADQQLTVATAAFHVAVSTPVPAAAVPHIVCSTTAPAATVPSHGSAASGGNDAAHVPSESDVPFDPAPQVVQDGRDADAQVALLQAYVNACIGASICKAK